MKRLLKKYFWKGVGVAIDCATAAAWIFVLLLSLASVVALSLLPIAALYWLCLKIFGG